MRQIIVALLVGIVGVGTGMWGTQAAEEAAPADTTPTTPAPAASAGGEAAPAGGGAAAGGACCKAGDTTPPLDLIKATPQAGLHNPYNGQIDAVAEEGHKKYLSFGCNGCHGGDTWVYGADDDTLFRLMALGSDGLKKEGYDRVKHEVVVGPMPPFGGIIKTSDDLWKVVAWIRSVNPSSVKLESTPYAKPN